MARAQTAWVLVRKGPGAPSQYFSIERDNVVWTTIAKDAVRFARRQDADVIRKVYVPDCRSEELVFG